MQPLLTPSSPIPPRNSSYTLRDVGREYGTDTGRPRRCGWLDAVATRYGARISGVDCIAVALLDVLSDLEELRICEAYEIDGERTYIFPATWRIWPA